MDFIGTGASKGAPCRKDSSTKNCAWTTTPGFLHQFDGGRRGPAGGQQVVNQ